MDRKMTHAAGLQKRKVLDEFVASTSCHKGSAIRAVNGQSVTKGRRTRNRPSIYDEAARGVRPDPFKTNWAEMLQCLGAQPDQTAVELLIGFRARYPEHYNLRQL